MAKRPPAKNLPVHSIKSSSDEADNFSIKSFSEMGSLSSTPLPHRHAFYEIIYIKGGKGAHVIDFESYPIVPGSLYLFSPDQIHFWQITKPVDGVRIKFSENFLLLSPSELYLTEYLDFFHNAESPPHLVLNGGKGAEIKTLFDRIEQEYRADGYVRDLKIRSYLTILLIEIQRILMAGYGKRDAVRGSALVSRFKKMVSKNFLTERFTSFYAEKLGISEAYLHELTKENTGLTPGQIIRKETAMEAKRMLAHTADTVSEIGYKLGFEDPSYFGRFFRRETGLSPKAFRAHILEKYQTFPL
ncbi:MAG: helix-turn-helix transcriptional regulator [Deltaproteobacteria bacterium]|nr:helix-turn-helix transcriptional regulator [Deltaproteobacteria bacterium]